VLISIVWTIVTLGVIRAYSSSIYVNIYQLGFFPFYISRPGCKESLYNCKFCDSYYTCSILNATFYITASYNKMKADPMWTGIAQ
jgi:hypothetical protein